LVKHGRRIVWSALALVGVAILVRVTCYKPTMLESCTACLRESPGHCAPSTANTQIMRRSGFDARDDAREQLSCGAVRDATCTLRPMEDLVFTCQSKVVDLPPDWEAPFASLTR